MVPTTASVSCCCSSDEVSLSESMTGHITQLAAVGAHAVTDRQYCWQKLHAAVTLSSKRCRRVFILFSSVASSAPALVPFAALRRPYSAVACSSSGRSQQGMRNRHHGVRNENREELIIEQRHCSKRYINVNHNHVQDVDVPGNYQLRSSCHMCFWAVAFHLRSFHFRLSCVRLSGWSLPCFQRALADSQRCGSDRKEAIHHNHSQLTT